jgi:hypothetical protein
MRFSCCPAAARFLPRACPARDRRLRGGSDTGWHHRCTWESYESPREPVGYPGRADCASCASLGCCPARSAAVPTLAWYRARGLWDDGLVPAHPTPDSADEDGRDRQALESILGHPLSDSPWPATALATGTRVRVIKDPAWDGPWATEFLGVIIDRLGVPELVRHPRAHPGELEYWVKFDEPQFDADGDGPYRTAQIWGRYLQPV